MKCVSIAVAGLCGEIRKSRRSRVKAPPSRKIEIPPGCAPGQVRCFVPARGVLPENQLRTQPLLGVTVSTKRPRRRAQPDHPPPHPRDLPPESGEMKAELRLHRRPRPHRLPHSGLLGAQARAEKTCPKLNLLGSAGMKRFLLFLIRFTAGPSHLPSSPAALSPCSQCALEAIEKYAAVKALVTQAYHAVPSVLQGKNGMTRSYDGT